MLTFDRLDLMIPVSKIQEKGEGCEMDNNEHLK